MFLIGITYNGRPLEWFSQRWVLRWPNLLLDCFGLGPAEEIPRLRSYSFEIWAKPLNPKLCSCFLSCISPPIFVPTPNFCPSPPIYTLFSMGQSWWRNLWYVSGSLHSQCLDGFLSLDHCSPISYHVLERGPTFCYWDDPLVTSAQWWILCSAGGFSQGTTLSSWLIHVLVGKLVEMRFLTQDASLHSRLVWACFGPGPPRKGAQIVWGMGLPLSAHPQKKNQNNFYSTYIWIIIFIALTKFSIPFSFLFFYWIAKKETNSSKLLIYLFCYIDIFRSIVNLVL